MERQGARISTRQSWWAEMRSEAEPGKVQEQQQRWLAWHGEPSELQVAATTVRKPARTT